MTDPELTETSPTRVCRKCSAQSALPGEFCPHCGTSYVKRSRPRLSKRKAIAIAVSIVVILALAGGFIAKRGHDQDVKADRAAAAERLAEKESQERSEKAAADKEAADDAERAVRATHVRELERNIVKHAKNAVKSYVLDGPILSASCTATGGGSTDDLTALTGTFDCLAVTKENKDGTSSGYGYTGTVDWQTGSLTWQLGS